MYYSLPRAEIVDRERFLITLCTGKSIVHLGATQANDGGDLSVYGSVIDPTTFLHSRISAVAKRCIGLDYNKQSIEFLRMHYGIENIRFADIEDIDSLEPIEFVPDVILMGELIEHLTNPGMALRNIRDRLMSDNSVLVATMPNALDSSNFLYGLLGREAHDPDHVAFYSPRLFQRLCEKVGLHIVELKYYQVTMSPNGRSYYRLGRFTPRKLFLWFYYHMTLWVSHGFSSGIIATVRKC